MNWRIYPNRLWLAMWAGIMLSFLCSPASSAYAAGASTHASTTEVKLYLPGIIGGARATQPPPTGSSLPSSLVGTWFAGNLLPYDFYNPDTGQWQGTNGLGQMYEFEAQGGYIYTAFFRSQIGACVSEVSVYKQGTARVQSANLLLKPATNKTRTVTVCGSNDDTTVNGPLDEVTIHWTLGYDDGGRRQLQLTEGALVTNYAKQGMAPELVGAWTRGVSSVDFYDLETGSFATPETDGGWFRFNADGSYTTGEYAHSTDNQGCALTGWLYMEGTLSVSGGTLTTTPNTGVLRIENACTPGQAQQQAWVDEAHTYSWSFWDRTTAPKLVLVPLERYQEFVFLPE